MVAIWLTASTALSQDAAALHAQAVRESLTPLRPGVPGKSPFWNEQAKQFIFAPAFDFRTVAGAKRYRFTITCADGGTLTFQAPQPWAPLTEVWQNVPAGTTKVVAEGVDAQGKVVGSAGSRSFHRGAVFNGPYGTPVLEYGESARVALASVIRE